MQRSSKHSVFYSREEVAKHNKDGDLWLVIRGGVYDVSKWILKHPGGFKVIQCLAGKDCSEAFRTFHKESIYRTILPAFQIGQIKELENGGTIEETEISKDYVTLRKTLEARGAFKPDCKCVYTTIFII